MPPTKKLHSSNIDFDLDEVDNGPQTPLWPSAGVQLDIDPAERGKHHGHLSIPLPAISTGPAQHRIPVCVINGHHSGPTVLLVAGVHGDEHEGSLTLHRLARELSAELLHGSLIILPALNIGGLQAQLRHNPLDQQNIDEAFPGNTTGTPSQKLAFEITQRFIKTADLIIDLRSGGHQLQFIPSAAVRFDNDKALSASSEECMIAFGAPNSLRLPASVSKTGLQATARAMQKPYVQTELGGGTINSVLSLSIAYNGCLNILRHKGMIKQEIELASTRLLEVRDNSYYVYATRDALYEPTVYPGESVWAKEPMGKLIPLNDTAAECTEVFASRNACLLATHPGGYVSDGQLLAILAEEVQA